MAEMTLLHNASTLAAMCGAASATASAARDRRIADTYYRSPRSNFNAASYMNYLRAPVPSRVPSSHGVGIHIHYQGQCPHHMTHGSSYAGGNLTLDGDSYGRPQDHRASPYAHHEGSSTSPCGCPRCYWRDFLTTDIEKYKTTCQQLRETYVWNLRELYYVGRVREVYDNHCEHHRLLFRDVCLMWELPEKVTLREEEIDSTSRVPTPHSVYSSGELKTPVSSSRVPTPLSRDSGSRRSVATAWVNKGKEKEIVGADVDVGTPVESICDDSEGKETVIETSPITTPNKTTAKPQLKNNKISMQRRLRQLWPTKTNEKSPDKALLV
ncbi:hypothetical protein F5X98DRAFT_387122 [Xylaria grammica]|nr:hypothetical protein F5X98DRAFT_387122 [Xylaria grammica]